MISNFAIYVIGMLLLIMAFTYLMTQSEGSTKLIVTGDVILLILGILGGILWLRKKGN